MDEDSSKYVGTFDGTWRLFHMGNLQQRNRHPNRQHQHTEIHGHTILTFWKQTAVLILIVSRKQT